MANEDSLRDQGDVQAAMLYDPRNIPRGYGGAPPAAGAASSQPQPPPIRGNTQPAVVTNTAKIILPANPDRKFLLIQNSDPLGNIWLAFGVDAAVNFGIKVASAGGAILFDNNIPNSAVSAIGDIASNPFVTIVSA